MSLNKCILFLACSSVVVLSTAIPKLRLARPETIKVNQTCKRDIECIKHAYCKGQKTCVCDGDYVPSLDMATCRITAGAPCTSQEGCSTMTNAECSEAVCTCRDNFMIDATNSSDCIMRPKTQGPPQPAGPRTQGPAQPAGPKTQGPNQPAEPKTQGPTQPAGPKTQGPKQPAERGPTAPEGISQGVNDSKDRMKIGPCINGTCICDTDHRFVNETGTCVKLRRLNEPCKQNYECSLNKTGSNAPECNNGKCAYHKANPTKKNGCPVQRPILMVLATLVVGTTLREFV